MTSADGQAAERSENDGQAPSIWGPLLQAHEFFRGGPVSAEGWSQLVAKGRDWESFYRDRWQHDKVVRSTHGVNCTGSCSWNVYVKDGLITWESQAVDYPSVGPDMPEYEPRGCPRGASFSWYTYSPLRVKYPYVRGSLLEMYREARERGSATRSTPGRRSSRIPRRHAYKSQRGRGGFVRASWDEVAELVAAAHVHTIKRYGPDRVAGFSPIPAMSMASYAAGTRFLSLIGGVILSFYDWYADLPPASPQVFGDQTDVPESGDWWNAGYLMIWGTNLPIDAHAGRALHDRGALPRPEGRRRLARLRRPHEVRRPLAAGAARHRRRAGDGHGPRDPQGVLRRPAGPVLPGLRAPLHRPAAARDAARARGRPRAGPLPARRRLSATAASNAEWKTVVLDERTGEPAVPNGSVGHRYGEGDEGRWNLDLGELEPALTLHGRHEESVAVDLPRFDVGATEGGSVLRRGVPAIRVGGQLVTTVLDLMLAQYGVGREGLPGDWPAGYDDPEQPYTPAWQEAITSVDGRLAIRVAREFARNAEVTKGRSMICMGAGTNHWFHSDQTYRTFLSAADAVRLRGRERRRLGPLRGAGEGAPVHGLAVARVRARLDVRPPRQQAGTPWFYLATDQWRYEGVNPDELASPGGRGLFKGKHVADLNALGARLGWMPSYPAFDRNPLDLVDEAERAGVDPAEHVVRELREGRLGFACEDPDAPENFPRVLTVWRANILGSSGKGHEYFLRHLLGTTDDGVRAEEAPEGLRPADVAWRDPAPTGQARPADDDRLPDDQQRALLRRRPAGGDLVREVRPLLDRPAPVRARLQRQAIAPPWEAKTDWDAFQRIGA